MDKLNSLAARAMGWELNSELDAPACYYYFYIESKKAVRINIGSPKETAVRVNEWNPSTCADDALMLLNKVKGDRRVEIEIYAESTFTRVRIFNKEFGPRLPGNYASENTTALAITRCALRAAGIPESEITAAME